MRGPLAALHAIVEPPYRLLRHGVVGKGMRIELIASGILVVTFIQMCVFAGIMLSR